MLSKKTSSSRTSTTHFDREMLALQKELFVQNQKIIANLEESCLSWIDGGKIDSDNCLEALENIAERKLGELQETQELYRRIAESLNQLKATDLSSINKMLVFRNVAAQSITPLTELTNVLRIIKNYLFENFNPLTSVCSKSFYSYVSFVCSKHQQQGAKELLKLSIRVFISFFSECIYHIFRPLFVLFQKRNLNVFQTLKERLTPVIVTETSEWKSLYPKVMKVFGRRHLKVLKDEQPSYFQMHEEFNCESCPNPFIRTIVNLQQLDSACSVTQKLKVLQEIRSSIQLDIKDHQESTFIQVDVTDPPQQDLLPCLQYCIMKSDRGGIVQAMEYIQLFFEKKETKRYYEEQFLDAKGVNHIIKSIKIAGMALRQRDTELSVMYTNISAL